MDISASDDDDNSETECRSLISLYYWENQLLERGAVIIYFCCAKGRQVGQHSVFHHKFVFYFEFLSLPPVSLSVEEQSGGLWQCSSRSSGVALRGVDRLKYGSGGARASSNSNGSST